MRFSVFPAIFFFWIKKNILFSVSNGRADKLQFRAHHSLISNCLRLNAKKKHIVWLNINRNFVLVEGEILRKFFIVVVVVAVVLSFVLFTVAFYRRVPIHSAPKNSNSLPFTSFNRKSIDWRWMSRQIYRYAVLFYSENLVL